MSIIDKALAAITPMPDAEHRAQATAKAPESAAAGSWLEAVLDHHDEIRAAFAAGHEVKTAADRASAMKIMARVLNGRSLAEALVLYPALGQAGRKAHAAHAYVEQSTAKAQMAELENIAPSKAAWLDKWAHVEGAVLTHMYEEESDWFVDVHARAEHPARLASRYLEEFDRYTR